MYSNRFPIISIYLSKLHEEAVKAKGKIVPWT
jgi:hypothetical protein